MILRASLTIALAVMPAAGAAQSVPATAEGPAPPKLDWVTLPEGRSQIGSMHGDVAVSAAGEIYISVEGSVTQRFAILGPNPGLQVYAADGRFLRNVERAPSDLHGFVIHRETGGEFIYGVRLAGGPAPADRTRARLDEQVIVKLALDGTVVMAVPASRVPDAFKNKANDGRPYMRLTGIAVAPNGDIYATDGYASDYIHRFDSTGNYLASFGGKQAPYGSARCTSWRWTHASRRRASLRPIVQNGRLVHLSLDGQMLNVVAEGMLRPAAVAVFRISWPSPAARPGERARHQRQDRRRARRQQHRGRHENNRTEPSRWRQGIVTAPHGVAFDQGGNLFVSEFSLFGRVHRFTALPQTAR